MSVPLIGLETEYGIIREDLDTSDPVEESMKLLECCPRKSVFRAWAYHREHTHVDMRGFQVDRLEQDEEEDEFCEQDRQRPYSYWEMKSDRVLVNGARFYNDHTHPEYATPECRTLFDLVAHDLAGEEIVRECVRRRNQDLGGSPLQVFKNNTDYSGHSYGTHDNYLISRRLPFDTWVRYLVPFMVTRQLFAGAGKIGSEGRNDQPFYGLQLSQRSDFVESLLSIETMTKRPIINTRDEPHASTQDYRRLHLIIGDANMSPYATALKVGTTRQVLAVIDQERLPPAIELADPVSDIKRVSRDRTGQVALKQTSGKTITPLEIQEWYLEHAGNSGAEDGDPQESEWVSREWARTLHDLRHQPEKLADRIDWAIKESLFNDFMEAEGLSWKDPVLQSVDLEYHNIDPDRGLYYGMQQAGEVTGLIPEKRIEKALDTPPKGTRAEIRGQMVDRELDRIKKIHWTGIEFDNGDTLDLTDIILPEDVERMLNSNKEQFAWK